MLTASKATGSRITFAGFTGRCIRINGPELAVEEIDATNLESEGWAESMEDDLIDPGELNAEVEFDGSAPPIGTRATLTVMWGTTGRSWSGEAYLKRFAPTAETRGKLTGNAVWRMSGEVSFT